MTGDDTTAPERSDVQRALDALDELLHASEPLSQEDIDAVETWADNVYLDTMRHRRLRRPCAATYESAMPGHRDATHACDLGSSHEPVPHHCPHCNSEWRDPDA